ncbi:MAG: septal ring lytic transglycosylase RlpA family protein [Balneolaceae bacterium]
MLTVIFRTNFLYMLLIFIFITISCDVTGSHIKDGRFYESGIASWYGADFHGGPTASGETYDMNNLTAAHKTLPFNTVVRVVNLRNGEVVTVRINDRGPFVEGRVIDLSRRAAAEIGILETGLTDVELYVLVEGGSGNDR